MFDPDLFLFRAFCRIERLKRRTPTQLHAQLDDLMNAIDTAITGAINTIQNLQAQSNSSNGTIATLNGRITDLQSQVPDPALVSQLQALLAPAAA